MRLNTMFITTVCVIFLFKFISWEPGAVPPLVPPLSEVLSLESEGVVVFYPSRHGMHDGVISLQLLESFTFSVCHAN